MGAQVVTRALRLMCEHTSAEHAAAVVWPALRGEIDASLAAAAELPAAAARAAPEGGLAKRLRRGSVETAAAGDGAGAAAVAAVGSGAGVLATALRRHAGRVATVIAEWTVIERGSRVSPTEARNIGDTLETLMTPAVWAGARVEYRCDVMQVSGCVAACRDRGVSVVGAQLLSAAWPLFDSARQLRLTRMLLDPVADVADAGSMDEDACGAVLRAARAVLARAGVSSSASQMRAATAVAVSRLSRRFPAVAWEFLLSVRDSTRSGAPVVAMSSEIYTPALLRAIALELPGAVARAAASPSDAVSDAAVAWGIVRAAGWAPPLVAAAAEATAVATAAAAAAGGGDVSMSEAGDGSGGDGSGGAEADVPASVCDDAEYVELLRALVDAVLVSLSRTGGGSDGSLLSAASALVVADSVAALAPAAARCIAGGESGAAGSVLRRVMDSAFRDALVRHTTTALAASSGMDDGKSDAATVASICLGALAAW